jgi:maltose-binding protein MalE
VVEKSRSAQPFGTLWALVADRYGEITNINLLERSFLVFDAGHHTANTYYNKHGLAGTSTTWDDLSMLEVIRQVKKKANETTHGQADFLDYFFDRILTLDTPASSFGKILYGDEQVYDITDDILEITEIVAKHAIQQLDIIYNHLIDVNILFLTGGMASAYYPYFKKHYASSYSSVLLAERKDNKDPVYNFDTVMANVVGYFNYLVHQLKKNMRNNNRSRSVRNDSSNLEP